MLQSKYIVLVISLLSIVLAVKSEDVAKSKRKQYFVTNCVSGIIIYFSFCLISFALQRYFSNTGGDGMSQAS